VKNLKNILLTFGFVLVSSLTVFAFQTVGTEPPTDIGVNEPFPQRPTSVYCNTHICDDGTSHDYYKTKCPVGTNNCTRQSCDEALLVILLVYCN